MGILDVGQAKVVSLIESNIGDGQVGRSSTLFTTAQTGLIDAIVGTDLSMTITNETTGLNILYELAEGDAIGEDINEFVIFFNDSTALLREVIPTIVKDDSTRVQINPKLVLDKNKE